jgi:hypothetical protein
MISLKINLSSQWYSWKITEFVLNDKRSLNHSLLLPLLMYLYLQMSDNTVEEEF